MLRKRLSQGAPILLALAVSACSDIGVIDVAPTLAPQFGVVPQEIQLCKVGPAGTTGTFTITASPTGVGTLMVPSQFSVNASPDVPSCVVVWRSGLLADPTVRLVITEVASSPFTAFDRIFGFSGLPFTTSGPSANVDVNFDNGATIVFVNKPVEGCTAGYWAKSSHFGSWPAAYTTSTLFVTAFGVNAYPGKTLLGVLNSTKGAAEQLGRQAVAALLNAAHPELENFGMTTSQVISDFSAAWASGQYATQQKIFERLNLQGCPLN